MITPIRVLKKLIKFISPLRPQFQNQSKAPFMVPNPNVTNLGYYKSFFAYGEDKFHSQFNRIRIKHDGRQDLVLTVSQARVLLIRKIFACELLADKETDIPKVARNWRLMRAMVEEAGCIDPELREDLRMTGNMAAFEDLLPQAKLAIEKMLEKDRSYFVEKRESMLEEYAKKAGKRLELLWPFEADYLKTKEFEVVYYELDKRGYDLSVLVYNLNKKLKKKITNANDAKVAAIDELTMKDSHTIKALLDEFKEDWQAFKLHEGAVDLSEGRAFIERITKNEKEILKAADTFETREKAHIFFVMYFAEGRKVFKEVVKYMSRLEGELSSFVDDSRLNYLNFKYITGLQDPEELKRDPLWLFTNGRRVLGRFFVTKLVVLTNVTAMLIAVSVFDRRTEEYEKRTGVAVGNRSRYFFRRGKEPEIH